MNDSPLVALIGSLILLMNAVSLFLINRSTNTKISGISASVGRHVSDAMQQPAQKVEDAGVSLTAASTILATTATAMKENVTFTAGLVSRYQSKLDESSQTIQDLTKKTDDLQSRYTLVSRDLSETSQMVVNLHDQIGARDAASAQRDAQIAELQGKVNLMEQSQVDTQRQLDQARSELETTKAQLAEAEARIRQLESERDSARSLADEQKRQLVAALEAERAKVIELQNKVKELESQVADLQAQLAARPKPNDALAAPGQDGEGL